MKGCTETAAPPNHQESRPTTTSEHPAMHPGAKKHPHTREGQKCPTGGRGVGVGGAHSSSFLYLLKQSFELSGLLIANCDETQTARMSVTHERINLCMQSRWLKSSA